MNINPDDEEFSEDELDDVIVAAINRAEAQIDHGEAIDFDQFAAEMRERITEARPNNR